MIWFYWKDGNRKYLNEVRRAQKLVLGNGLYFVCMSRNNLVDIFLFYNYTYVARGSVKLQGNVARIYNLYTVPQSRGCGYGAAILQKCIDIAMQNGYTSLDAIIRKDNKASRKLHRKFKFRKNSYNKDKYRYFLEIKDATTIPLPH